MVDGGEDGSSMICTWKSSQQCRCRICIIQVPVSREQTWNNHMVTTLDCREGLHVQNKFSSFLRVWFGIVMQDIGVSYLKSCFFFSELMVRHGGSKYAKHLWNPRKRSWAPWQTRVELWPWQVQSPFFSPLHVYFLRYSGGNEATAVVGTPEDDTIPLEAPILSILLGNQGHQ